MSDCWIEPHKATVSHTAGESFGLLTIIPETDDVAYAILYTLEGIPLGAIIPGRWPGKEMRTTSAGDKVAVIRRLSADEVDHYRQIVSETHGFRMDAVRFWEPSA